jgi:hypothetical protein
MAEGWAHLAQTVYATMPVDGFPAAQEQSMGPHAGDQIVVIDDGRTDDRRVGAAGVVQGCVGDLFSRRREAASSEAHHGNREV